MKYAVVYEQTPRNWAAYVPDLPGCVATGPTREVVEQRIGDAIRMHVNAMREVGETIPPATSSVGFIEAG